MEFMASSVDAEVSYPHHTDPTPVFLHACVGDASFAASLCLVCKTAHEWLKPVLYRTVVLSSSRQIIAFERTLLLSHPSIATTVRHLWLGPSSSHVERDLSYASTAWPVTLLHQILARCTSLQSLAIVNFAQHLMYRIAGVIPASVMSIHAGPVHGHLDVRHLRCAANLRSVTSMDTYLSDWEVQELAGAPFLKSLRRFYSARTAIEYAFDQLAAVRGAPGLETMEVLCCTGAADIGGTLETLKGIAKGREGSDDERVVITARTGRGRDGLADGTRAFYDDWVDSLGNHGPSCPASGLYRSVSAS
ncbi:uncharacterized protein B0H18DRAFT_1026396 [Fomitopsis serialis]|uniref:uncharacterized protein n=1 Tax=Fomitopsis serialis TaxID=139415 RepID=UPI002008CB67|nr:uncharacterized protein B0H18DRAFT_1026396 [Neoantrodia serialis]KAH9919832.1 hypothetical protein B0H18DRAFT_1026396 [Neoantrodia serialis]